MSLALVTGSNGHLGANLVRELLERGWTVRALVRVTSNLDGLKGLDVELCYGDLLDADSLDRAMVGIDTLFHAGAVYRNWAADPDEILKPAIMGTENALRAAAAAGVRRVVLTSSCNAVGFTDDPDQPRDETHWNDELHLPYVQAKVQAEQRAWQLAEELGLDMIAILPTGILGPHDHRITPTTAYLRDVLAGKGPILAGTTNMVHVGDVARAEVLAAERGRPGERYLIGGDNIDDQALADLVAARTGKRPTVLSAPRVVLMALASAMEAWSSVSGAEPALTRAMVRTAWGRHISVDTGKARRELGFEPRSPDEILDDTMDWLIAVGQLSAPAHRAAA